jgi:preprotein translocase subunit SecD
MNGKRISIFVLVIIVCAVVVGLTSENLVKNIKLGLDLKGGFEILYLAEPIAEGEEVTKETLVETARSLEKRVNAQGLAEPDITTEGSNRIRIRLAGITNESEVRALLKKPAELSFRGPDGTKEMVGSDFEVGGASLGYDSSNRPQVEVRVKDAEKFKEITERLKGKPLAIYLEEEILSAPTVNDVIPNGVAVISGNYTLTEAKQIKDTINLGALPLKLSELYTQSVGASLGQLSLDQTVRAAIIGSLLVIVFMLIFYRGPGAISGVSLVMYVWMLLGVIFLLKATLTLPGIAAVVLGLGMAVDANIITFERIREEIRNGKSIMSSLRSGSRSSFRTIIDANVTTILAALVLYFVGTGSVQGFALILIFSILVSITTNVLFSRLLLSLLVRGNLLKKPSHFGVKESEINAL